MTTARVAITLQQWSDRPDHLIDHMAYEFYQALDDLALDPWRDIDDVEVIKGTDQAYVQYANGTHSFRKLADTIYISAKTYSSLNST